MIWFSLSVMSIVVPSLYKVPKEHPFLWFGRWYVHHFASIKSLFASLDQHLNLLDTVYFKKKLAARVFSPFVVLDMVITIIFFLTFRCFSLLAMSIVVSFYKSRVNSLYMPLKIYSCLFTVEKNQSSSCATHLIFETKKKGEPRFTPW